jgi:hypothetical protein
MTAESIDRDLVIGRWTHAHEEDSEDEMVFRHAGSPLPPSRGRKSLELKPDGELLEQVAGPSDKKQRSSGRWLLEANGTIKLFKEGSDQPSRTLEVISVDPERLVVRKG